MFRGGHETLFVYKIRGIVRLEVCLEFETLIVKVCTRISRHDRSLTI
jgi:hypothetical protein